MRTTIASSMVAELIYRAVTIFLIVSLIAGAFVCVYNYYVVLRQRSKLPPGPFPLPILGNYLHLPKWRPWIKFEEWSREYQDPMITIWLGSTPLIILNDAWTASELLEQQADVFSSRPSFTSMGDLPDMTNNNQAVLEYGERWRLHRKLTV